jgi:hypothetical protein
MLALQAGRRHGCRLLLLLRLVNGVPEPLRLERLFVAARALAAQRVLERAQLVVEARQLRTLLG